MSCWRTAFCQMLQKCIVANKFVNELKSFTQINTMWQRSFENTFFVTEREWKTAKETLNLLDNVNIVSSWREKGNGQGIFNTVLRRLVDWIKSGVLKLFGWRPQYLFFFLEIFRPSRCKISHKRAFIWALFGKID